MKQTKNPTTWAKPNLKINLTVHFNEDTLKKVQLANSNIQ